ETRVPVTDIDEQAREATSLMPAGLVFDLSPDDLANLLAFLLSKPAQEALHHRQPIHHVLAIGPFAPGADVSPLPLDAIKPSETYPGQGGSPVGWVPIDTTGD